MSTEYIFSQIFVAFAYVLTFVTYLLRNRNKIIVVNLLSSCMSVVSLFLLAAWTGLGNVVIGIFRNIAFMVRDKYLGESDKITKTDYAIYAGLEVAVLTVGIFTFAGLPSVFAMVSMSINNFSVTNKNPFLYKIINIPASLTYVVYNILITSYVGAILEVVVLSMVILAIIRDVRYYRSHNVNPFKIKEINRLKEQQKEEKENKLEEAKQV